ncbi:Uncharacterised protein [Mycobacteroides abscessus subsp. massiliense]|nr:Uncharacterised protein [Mycobacteroides abscessus subsp. massiliense]
MGGTVCRGASDRLAAIPAEPLGFLDDRVGHQGFQRIDFWYARDFHESAAQAPRRRQQYPRGGGADLGLSGGLRGGLRRVRGAEHRARRDGPHRRGGVDVQIGKGRGLGARALVRGCVVGFFGIFAHQSRYFALGGAGAGPSTLSHLRYKAFHVPSRRMRSRVRLT